MSGRLRTDIAVIGMAGRFPGAADVDGFWRLLLDGDGVVRLAGDAAGANGLVPVVAELDAIPAFDAAFFHIGARDAALMDPQHRHLLEVAWTALEHAGYDPGRMPGPVGVFAASGAPDYLPLHLLANAELMAQLGLFYVRHAGNDKDFLATRISYALDLEGPSLAVQTGASSSLSAVHLAAQSLIAGECDFALAGGVTIDLPHGLGYHPGDDGRWSPTGRARPFDDDADGAVPGSGAAVVVLRRLDDARRAGDTVHAVLRGSVIGHHPEGFTAAAVAGRTGLLREALARADAPAEGVALVAGGTGVRDVDAAELAAVASVFGPTGGSPHVVSIAGTVGHLGAAAGVASLVAVIQGLRHHLVPPTRNFARANSLPGATAPVVPTTPQSWPPAPTPRRAVVTAPVDSGAGAVVVVEEGPADPVPSPSRPWQLLTWSGRTVEAAEVLTDHLAVTLGGLDPARLADVAHTLAVGRRAFVERRIAVVASPAAAQQVLRGRSPALVTGRAITPAPPVAFAFPGGGTQYPAMARGLVDREPVFAEAFARCLEELEALGVDQLKRVLFPAPDQLAAAGDELRDRATLALPAIFSIGYAMALTLQAWGVRPSALIGHSLGEYVAACLAGVWSLPDALSIVVTRGRLFDALPPGAMLSVGAPVDVLAPLLDSALSVAAINSATSTVVAGAEPAIAALTARLEAQGLDHRRLAIRVAAHSRELDPILPTFRRALRTLRFSPPAVPCVSNVTGGWLSDADAVDPEYWVRHLRATVRFADGVATLLTEPRAVIELGPGGQISALIRQHPAAAAAPLVVSTLRHAKEEDDDQRTWLHAVGRLWAVGVDVDWNAIFEGESRQRVPLPTYPFARQCHWFDPQRGLLNDDNTSGLVRPRDPEQWIGHARWVRRDSPQPITPAPATWLVFAGAHPIGALVAQTLRDRGARVVVVRAGATFAAAGRDEFELRPADADDYTSLLGALGDRAAPLGVVFVWPLDGPTAGDPGSRVTAMQRGAFTAGLRLLQAVPRSALGDDVRVWFCASGFESVHQEAAARPEAALLRGLALVGPAEWPGLRAGTVDLGDGSPAVMVEALMKELRAGGPEPRVALRGRTRFVHEVEMAPPPEGPIAPLALRAGGTYLITGGLGGVGLAHARYLARQYRARLVLVSRRPTSGSADVAAALERLGAEVTVASADVTDRAAMRAVVLAARRRYGRIDGVFHAAGVLEPTLMAVLDPAAAERSMAAKTAGMIVLDDVLADDPPELVVSLSSISALVGIPGQTAYAAASAFLNAWASGPPFAGQRRLTVNYGPWRDAGMTARHPAAPGHVERRRGHPLVGRRSVAAPDSAVFETIYRPDTLWVLGDHAVRGGPTVLPGAAAFETIAAAFAIRTGTGDRPPCTIAALHFVEPLAVARDGSAAVRVSLVPAGHDLRYTLESRPTGLGWREHVVATVRRAPSSPPAVDLTAIRARCAVDRGDDSTAPHRHQARALEFGPRWHAGIVVRYGIDEALASIEAPASASVDGGYAWHPALVDLGLTAGLALAPAASDDRGAFVWVPSGCDSATLWRAPGRRFYSHVRFRAADSPDGVAVFDITVVDEAGAVLGEFSGWRLRRVAASRLTGTVPSGGAEPARDPVSLLADRHGIDHDDGVAALERALAYPARKLIVSSLDVVALRAHLATLTDGAGHAVGRAARRADLSTSFVAPRTDLERQLADIWARHLSLDRVGVHDHFFELGGESLIGLRLFGEIRRTFGVALPVDTLFAAPTVAALAEALLTRTPVAADHAPPADDGGSAVVIQRGVDDGRPPLFCVHDQNGYVLPYRDLARALGAEQPFVALQAAGLDDPRQVDRTVPAMAARYLRAIRHVQPVGPYWLSGSSLGGIVAFEIAQQLIASGERVALLALFDSWTPADLRRWWFCGDEEPVWARARRHLRELVEQGPRQYVDTRLEHRRSWEDYQRHAQAERERHAALGPQVEAHLAAGTSMPPETLAFYLEQVYGEAYRSYEARPYAGVVTLFRAEERGHHRDVDPTLGWSQVELGGLEVITVPGPHGLMVRDPYVATLGRALSAAIHRAAGGGASSTSGAAAAVTAGPR
jgi:acyl transferase domain-containing protein